MQMVDTGRGAGKSVGSLGINEGMKMEIDNKQMWILCEAKSASHNQIYGAKTAPFMRNQNRVSHKLYNVTG